jgi:hypothetical protein
MKILLPILAFALAGAAFAEDAPKADAQKPKPPLNLRLDESTSAAPRVTFGPPSAAQTKEDREKGLPELGGKPSHSFDKTLSTGSNSSSPTTSVIPSAMDPAVNRQ